MPETYSDFINRILRDHEGYTGDGRGGVGDLPIGDRSTARKVIDKADLRSAFTGVIGLVSDSTPQEGGFDPATLAGPFYSSTGGAATTPTWSLTDGVLKFNADQAGTGARYWESGHRWLGFAPVEIIVEGRASDTLDANGLYAMLGTPGGAVVHFMYGHNGAVGVYDSGGAKYDAKGGAATYPGVAFPVGQTAQMRVVIQIDGTGFIEATNASGAKARHPITNITERGVVAVAVRRAGAGSRSRFSVRPPVEDASEKTNLVPSPLKPLPAPLVPSALNGILGYGQSNAIGAEAAPLISVAQPYSNVTFAGGPRGWDKTTGAWSYLPLKPLVEDEDATGGSMSSGVPLAESPMSGAANYASSMMAVDGVVPSSHVILAATAGRGSMRITDLDKDSAWYSDAFLPMVAAAAGAGSYTCHVVPWVQGERDADTATPYATYLSLLTALASDIETDVKAATGQASPVYMLVVQVNKYSTTSDGAARAQFDAPLQSDRIFTIAPSYRIPYGNSIHYSAAGAKLAGAYMGRAYAQMMQGYKPDALRAISATMRGSEIRVRFDVPHPPLQFDVAALAPCAQNGFVVRVGGSTVAPSSIAIDGQDVVIKMPSAPAGTVLVRYGLDTVGTGRPATEGGGNLRDSAPEKINISGNDLQLFNAALAFQMGVTRLSE